MNDTNVTIRFCETERVSPDTHIIRAEHENRFFGLPTAKRWVDETPFVTSRGLMLPMLVGVRPALSMSLSFANTGTSTNSCWFTSALSSWATGGSSTDVTVMLAVASVLNVPSDAA